MVIDPKRGRLQTDRRDWGASKVRMVSRFDKVINWARRGRPTRESHAHHHQKTKRMER